MSRLTGVKGGVTVQNGQTIAKISQQRSELY